MKRIPGKRIMSLLFHYPEELKEKQKEELKKITENKELNILYKLVQRFGRLIKERELSGLDIWLDDALCSGIKELKVFAAGLQNVNSEFKLTHFQRFKIDPPWFFLN